MPLAPQALEYLPLARHRVYKLYNPFITIESFKAILLSCFYRRENLTSKRYKDWGTRVAQLVEHTTSAQVMISRFVG